MSQLPSGWAVYQNRELIASPRVPLASMCQSLIAASLPIVLIEIPGTHRSRANVQADAKGLLPKIIVSGARGLTTGAPLFSVACGNVFEEVFGRVASKLCGPSSFGLGASFLLS